MNQALMRKEYKDDFDAKFENVGGMISRAQEYLLSLDIDEGAVSISMLALAEAFNNVVEHSYADRSDGRAELSIHANERKILFQIKDWGIAPPENLFYDLDPMPDPLNLPEGGWGLALINTVMDEIYYRFEDGANKLDLIKKI